jgi:hypothetical protein
MDKVTKLRALYAVTHLLIGCAAVQPASEPLPAPQLGKIPIGASLIKDQLQEIRLLTIDESRSEKEFLWISGKGGAKIAGGSGGFYFWNSTTPPQLEIELPLNSCTDLIPNPVPVDKALLIVGKGQFLSVQMSGIYAGKFVLNSVVSCELQAK